MPGSLPVANKEAVYKTLLLGKALGANLVKVWNFERKNYFYPDLPKGYQITSSTNPPLTGGEMVVVDPANPDLTSTKIRINHVHLEEDAGKLMHGQDGHSYVDLNRAGTPLVELVTEPDIRTALQAKLFLQKLQQIARALSISEADMEHGHLRCDANISVHISGQKLGTKVEVKNMNSFTSVERAIQYELTRQSRELQSGNAIKQETRSWNEAKGETVGMRSKEEIEDYRYVPEPDIPPIMREKVSEFTDSALEVALSSLELPDARIKKLAQSGIVGKLADEFISHDSLYHLVIDIVKLTKQTQEQLAVAMFLHDPIVRFATEHNIPFEDIPLTSHQIVQLYNDISSGKITHQLFKLKLSGLLNRSISLTDLEKEASKSAGLDISSLVGAVLKEHASAVEQYKSGDQKVYAFLVGQVMAKTNGQADPQKVRTELTKILDQR